MMNALEACRVPTVAAINGVALAGGLELALCCDLMVAQVDARIRVGWDQPSATALRAWIASSEAHAHSFDRTEGLDAFAQKRTPAYRGR